MAIIYLGFHHEPLNRLFELYEQTWANKRLVDFWKWEYLDNIRNERNKILIAEDGENLIGDTIHLSFDLLVARKTHQA